MAALSSSIADPDGVRLCGEYLAPDLSQQ